MKKQVIFWILMFLIVVSVFDIVNAGGGGVSKVSTIVSKEQKFEIF